VEIQLKLLLLQKFWRYDQGRDVSGSNQFISQYSVNEALKGGENGSRGLSWGGKCSCTCRDALILPMQLISTIAHALQKSEVRSFIRSQFHVANLFFYFFWMCRIFCHPAVLLRDSKVPRIYGLTRASTCPGINMISRLRNY